MGRYSFGELFSGLSIEDREISIEDRSEGIANDSLPYRVQGREWETAKRVARYVLEGTDRIRLIPLNEAQEIVFASLRKAGFTVVREDRLQNLVRAMEAEGYGTIHGNESPKLRKMKEAFKELRSSLRTGDS